MEERSGTNMESPQPHHLPGIDVDDALKRLGIDWNQYVGLLHRFTEEVKEPIVELRNRMNRQDWEGARGQVLTISVACMRLCADKLRASAREVDRAIQEQSDNIAESANRLEDMVKVLSDSIANSSNPFDDADVQEVIDTLYDYAAIGATLRHLESALLTRNNRQINERLNEWEHLGIPPDLLEGFAQIKSLSGSGALEDAAAITNILSNGLPDRNQ